MHEDIKKKWFYSREGKKYGPFASSQLREMALAGKLHKTDLLWKEGMSSWRKAGDSSKLFERSVPAEQSAVNSMSAEEPATGGRTSLSDLARRAAAATALAAERTKLLSVTLPAAYLELGKYCRSAGVNAEALADEMAAVDRLEVLASTGRDITDSSGPLAKRMEAYASKGLALASRKKAELELTLALRRLGNSAFEKCGDAAWPEATIRSIRLSQARIDEIDNLLGKAMGGVESTWFRKRRMVGVIASVACVVLVGIGLTRPRSRTEVKEDGRQHIVPDIDVSEVLPQGIHVQPSTDSVTKNKRSLQARSADSEPTSERRQEPRLEHGVPPPHVEWVPPAVTLETLWTKKLPAKESVGYQCKGAVEWSRDLSKVAIGLQNGCLVLCDPENGPDLVTESAALWDSQDTVDLEATYPVADISFSPSGKYVAWITESLNCTWGLATVDTGKLVRHSPRAQSRLPWHDGKIPPQWRDWGVPAIHMVNDTTLLFASGAGVIEYRIDGTARVLNGCVPPTRLEADTIREENYSDNTKPLGEWFDDSVRQSLADLERQGKPYRGWRDVFKRYMVAFSPNGKYCAVMYGGQSIGNSEYQDFFGADQSYKVAVYEVGGKKVFEQPYLHGNQTGGGPAEVFYVFDDMKILEARLGSAVVYHPNKAPERLVHCDGVALCLAIHPTLPCVLAIEKGRNVRVYALDEGRLDPFERRLAELSVHVDGANDGAYGAITPDFGTLIVGVRHSIKAVQVEVLQGAAEPE